MIYWYTEISFYLDQPRPLSCFIRKLKIYNFNESQTQIVRV